MQPINYNMLQKKYIMKKNNLQLLLSIVLLGISTATVIARENVPGSGMIVNKPNNQFRELQSSCAPATSKADLDINNVRAKVLGGGDMWWDLANGSYFVPKPALGTRGPSSMYAASLWIGGYDAGKVLKVAGMTYRQTGNDFWPGPINANGSTDIGTCLNWDKHFTVNREDVEAFSTWYEGGQIGAYTIPNSILNWPAFADPITGIQSASGNKMAPFHDADGDGTYNPYAGDYPDFDIKGTKGCNATLYGDQALFWVFNDKGNIHSETGGPAIGLEVKAQAFGFKTTDEINNMTFYKYIITNKSSFRLDSTFFGVWVDSDLGAFNDDYVGCDVSLGLGYSYNGDLIDGPSGNGELIYGANPPAVGVDFFEGPFADVDGIDNPASSVPKSFLGYGDNTIDNERLGMGRFVYYNNNTNSVNGNPTGADDFYQYLTGSWRNGQRITYGGDGTAAGGATCKYMFPGSSDPQGFGTGSVQQAWDESVLPDDRRFLQSAGPFKLQPGAVNTITKGVVWARATQGGNLASLALLKGADFKAQQLFDNCFKTLDGPTAPNLTVQELDKEIILFWTNPTNSNNANEAYSEDYNLASGSDIPYKFQGYMVYQLKDQFVSQTDVYDVDKARLVYQSDIVDGVTQIVNYTNDLTISALVPQEMVNGANKGVGHSIKITEDKFAVGNTALVNHKTYYYAIIAYGYSPTQLPTNLNQLNDYKPFIAGRKQSDPLFAHSAIPHIVAPELGGTEQHAVYGNGPKLKRIEGQGNGGNILDFTDETVARILSSPSNRVIDPVYEKGAGPVKIQVIDPLNVVEESEFRFKLKAKYTTTGTLAYVPQDNSTWELQNITTGETVNSETTIKVANEQIINGQPSGTSSNVIPKWGLSVTVQYTYDPGNASAVKNSFLEATMTFADPTKRWLFGLPDVDGETDLNWIRSGTTTYTATPAFSDYKGAGFDDGQDYEKILGGMWAPYKMTAATTNAAVTTGGPNWNSTYSATDTKLNNLASVDIVITKDKDKWTRCPVLELQESTVLAIGGAAKLSRRKSPSVDKNGYDVNDGSLYNNKEGDLISTMGMGWFPGYAINLETGERLNMAFGEDSWYPSENGADMLWNPTSSFFGPGGVPLFGGKHYIYVFGHNGDAKYTAPDPNPGVLSDIPRYDSAFVLNKLLNFHETNAGGISAYTLRYKKDVFADAMWVNIPLLASGRALLETDVKIRLRVAKSYQRAYSGTINPSLTLPLVQSSDTAATPINLNYPTYEFNTADIETHTYHTDIAKDALGIINIVPNPYYAYSAYEQKTLDNVVKITNLPEKCKISIYTLNGNLVRTFNKDEPKTSIDWDLKNSKRIPIASGLYIIHIDAPGIGQKTLKWFGVMRPIDLESF